VRRKDQAGEIKAPAPEAEPNTWSTADSPKARPNPLSRLSGFGEMKHIWRDEGENADLSQITNGMSVSERPNRERKRGSG